MKNAVKKSIIAYAKKNILLIALILSGIFLIINLVPRTVLKENTIKNSQLLANSVGMIFNDTVKDIEHSMDEIDVIINHSNLSKDEINNILDRFVGSNPLFTSIEIINSNSQVEYSAPIDSVGMDRSGESILKNQAISYQFYWSDVFTFFMTGDPVISVIKEYNGHIFQAYIDLKQFSALSVSLQEELSDKFSLTVMDNHGIYVINSNPEFITQRVQNVEFQEIKNTATKGKKIFESADMKALVSVSKIETLHWYVALYANNNDIFSAINFVNIILTGASGLIVFLLWLYYIKTNKISRLVRALADKVESFTNSDVDILLPDGGFIEFETLNRNYRNMSDALKRSNAQLFSQAYRDILTGLYNRRAALDFINKNISDSLPMVLCYCDLNRFKEINDKLGHSTGDLFLEMIARRLRVVVAHPDNLFRVGGDEFIYIIMASAIDDADVKDQIDAILDEFKKPYYYNQEKHYFSISIGTANFPQDAESADDLLKFADMAMYKAKKDGTDFQVFNHDIQDNLLRKLYIKDRLRHSNFQSELYAALQPQYELLTGGICGFEVFTRWKNPELGLINPDEFIPIAEDCYAISNITYWVFDQALDIVKGLNDQYDLGLKVSINVSVIDLLQNDFIQTLKQKISAAGLDPRRIELEITEGVIIENYSKIKSALNQAADIGFSVALDDFGKGYSSLAHLNELKINTLKIDKEFLESACQDDRSKELLKSICDLSSKLDINLIVEGVEKKEQMDLLSSLQIYAVQGYYFAKPFSIEKLPEFLASENKKRH